MTLSRALAVLTPSEFVPPTIYPLRRVSTFDVPASTAFHPLSIQRKTGFNQSIPANGPGVDAARDGMAPTDGMMPGSLQAPGADAQTLPDQGLGLPADGQPTEAPVWNGVPEGHPDPNLAIRIHNTKIDQLIASLERQIAEVDSKIDATRSSEKALVAKENELSAEVGQSAVLTDKQEQALADATREIQSQGNMIGGTEQMLEEKLRLLKELEKLKLQYVNEQGEQGEAAAGPIIMKPSYPRPKMVSLEAEHPAEEASPSKVMVARIQLPPRPPQPIMPLMMLPGLQMPSPPQELSIVIPTTVASPKIPQAATRAGDYSEEPLQVPDIKGPLIGDSYREERIPRLEDAGASTEDLSANDFDGKDLSEESMPLASLLAVALKGASEQRCRFRVVCRRTRARQFL